MRGVNNSLRTKPRALYFYVELHSCYKYRKNKLEFFGLRE